MAKDLFNRYIWLVNTIYRAGKITFEEINERWVRTEMSGGEDLPLKTFHNHKKAVQDIFDINIECNKSGGYYYYIENVEDIEHGGLRTWLLNTFSVSNLISESHKLRGRILFENIPSGQKFLAPVVEAMRDGMVLEITHSSFWKDNESTFEVEPYCVKVFRQRWYMLARSVARGTIRVYSLDRISEVKPSGKSFVFPEDFDSSEYFRDSFGIIVDDAYPPETIKLEVYGTKVKYFRSLPLHPSQREVFTGNDYSQFQYYMSPTYDLKQELLSHGDEITIVSPESLRQEIKEIAERITRKYCGQEKVSNGNGA